MLFLLSACSTMKPSPGDGPAPPVDWDMLSGKIQTRVKYVAAFAFTLEIVKEHKDEVCLAADKIAELLEQYNDRDASFEAVRHAVMVGISKLNVDKGVQDAIVVLVDIALTEAFNYAWQYYDNLIDDDRVRTSITIAKAVAKGLRDACGMSFALMEAEDYPDGIFTVPTG